MKKRNDVDFVGEPSVRAGEIWPILRSPQKAAPSQSSGASLSAVSPEFLFFPKKSFSTLFELWEGETANNVASPASSYMEIVIVNKYGNSSHD